MFVGDRLVGVVELKSLCRKRPNIRPQVGQRNPSHDRLPGARAESSIRLSGVVATHSACHPFLLCSAVQHGR
jgi:hypothetical protein